MVLIPKNGFDGGNIHFICLLVMLGLFPCGLKINFGLWSGFLHDDFMFNLIPLSFGFSSYHNWNKLASWIKTVTKDIISSDAPLGLSSGIKKFKNLLIFKVANAKFVRFPSSQETNNGRNFKMGLKQNHKWEFKVKSTSTN